MPDDVSLWIAMACQDPDTFVHRVGRTARMGREGAALVCFLSVGARKQHVYLLSVLTRPRRWNHIVMVAPCIILELGVMQTETSLQVYLLPPEDAYVEFMQVRYEACSLAHTSGVARAGWCAAAESMCPLVWTYVDGARCGGCRCNHGVAHQRRRPQPQQHHLRGRGQQSATRMEALTLSVAAAAAAATPPH
jgi:hypothetical protein